MDKHVRGAGFRGEVLGAILYRGFSYDSQADQVIWQGDLVKQAEAYSFVTVDFFNHSSFFPMIRQEAQTDFLFPLFIRQQLGNYLNSKDESSCQKTRQKKKMY